MSGQATEHAHIFTLEEAQALLPALQALFARFAEARAAAGEAFAMLERIERRRTRANTLELARPLREQREELGAQAEEMRAVVRAVQDMGVEIKRLEPALIDFPYLRGNHVVYLCWQEGEATIAYWHEIDAGFGGRRPL